MGLGCDSSSHDSNYSESVLNFIGQILMEEDIEDKPSMFYDPLGLQVTEKSFCDAFGQKYRPPPTQCQPTDWVGNHACSQPNWQPNNGSQVLSNPSNGANNIGDVQELLSRNIFTDAESVLQLRRGIEEASDYRTANELLKQIRQHSSPLVMGLRETLKKTWWTSQATYYRDRASQPGFRPAERIEETGRRLTKYCERFNVPFEYHAIASNNWETIEIERLTIDRSEVLAVNCCSLKNS
ncbi:Scarecrow-like protein 34 [Morella rubra]|uniref:Scarecrow-like protein 34 n=1 Tax=Morella rubra TaxID=262757 RepID=A0A6A1WLC2_9ROSI|nr:Scarecrow-like protein 34 [Morella rubra]